MSIKVDVFESILKSQKGRTGSPLMVLHSMEVLSEKKGPLNSRLHFLYDRFGNLILQL